MSNSKLSRSSKEFKARVASVFGLPRVAARIASTLSLSGMALRVAKNFSDEHTSVVKKTPGKGYCVKSEKNSDWSGGCYPSKGEAEKRLDEVEMMKAINKK